MKLLAILLLGSADPAAFEPSGRQFADASACKAHLVELAARARGDGYAAIQGPYAIGGGDVRIHMVLAQGSGHRVEEHRCLGEKLSARSWDHEMEPAEEPFTIESAARRAEWLKKGAPQQD